MNLTFHPKSAEYALTVTPLEQNINGIEALNPLYCLLRAEVICRLRNSSSVTFTQYGTVGLQSQMKCVAKVESTEAGSGTVTLPVSSVVC